MKTIFEITPNENDLDISTFKYQVELTKKIKQENIDLVLNDVGFFSASKTDYAECVKQWEDIEPLLGDWKIVDKKEERRNNSHD